MNKGKNKIIQVLCVIKEKLKRDAKIYNPNSIFNVYRRELYRSQAFQKGLDDIEIRYEILIEEQRKKLEEEETKKLSCYPKNKSNKSIRNQIVQKYQGLKKEALRQLLDAKKSEINNYISSFNKNNRNLKR